LLGKFVSGWQQGRAVVTAKPHLVVLKDALAGRAAFHKQSRRQLNLPRRICPR
jgi:hypothetical protein